MIQVSYILYHIRKHSFNIKKRGAILFIKYDNINFIIKQKNLLILI